MKLALQFDASVGINVLRQVIQAAGDNTTITFNAAHGLDVGDLLSVVSAAGSDKQLVLAFDGARLTPRNLQQATSFAGEKTAIQIGKGQEVNTSALLAVINAAGDGKQVRVAFNGAQADDEALRQLVDAAGRQVGIDINGGHAVPIDRLLGIIDAAAKEGGLGVEFNGAQLLEANILQAVERAGGSTGIGINSAQAMSEGTLQAVMQAAGDGTHLGLSFHGGQLDDRGLLAAIEAAGTNTHIQVNTAQAMGAGALLLSINATGNTKRFSVEFNGAELPFGNLQQAVEAAGINTAISVNTAQAMDQKALHAAIEAAGDLKRLDAQFNAMQMPVESLGQLVDASGSRIALTVAAAQALPLPALLEVVQAAG
ncbi:hypothetical protein PSm6_03910 [Pseudomonas solani]|uniref:Uncharacterized protein n=1 Tax=Pseudomonas solani TaxID=2731552 RepID=A0ABM7L3C7_9PSED|nr:hypothetical protein [Pseudomonas solani]BCD83984.1 hypothetical protein PSm6_03910 [Pseudomonas solani]